MTLKLEFEQLGSGTAIILLHGLFGSGRNLGSIARHLSSDYTVYLPDLRNHGDSPHHETMDYTTMSCDIDRLIEENNIGLPILIGHSMGGKVAMVNALQNPDRVSILVILDIAPVVYRFEYFHIIESLQKLDLDAISSRRDADKILAEQFKNTQFRQFLLQNMVRSDGHYRWRLNLDAILKNISNITGFPDTLNTTYNGPCLFLGGEKSEYIGPEHQSEIARLFPSARVRKVRNAGHWLHAEQGETVNREILNFLLENQPG